MFKFFVYLIFFVLFLTVFFFSSALLLKSFFFLANQIRRFGSRSSAPQVTVIHKHENEEATELLDLYEGK